MAFTMSANCLISPEPLLEQFNCPICLNTMNNVWVTTCLHRFCENCIKESINANHRCPLCNQNLQQDGIQHDAQYDSILEAIGKAIQKAEAQKATTFADQIVTHIGDNSMKITLEELFRDTLVSSLANHLTSENDMRIRYQRKKNEIEKAYNQTVVELQQLKLPKEQYKQQLDLKTDQFNREIKALDEEIRKVQILFIQAYKVHLQEHISNFGAVSTQVHVTLWKDGRLFINKDKTYPIKLMRPEDRMEILLPVLDELVEANEDKIVRLGDPVLFTCFNPLEFTNQEAVIKKLNEMDNDDEDNNILSVSRVCRPVLEHKLLRGTLVVIHGDILLESEVPKQCFIQTYNENPNQEHLVDYFVCHTCLKKDGPLRWICKNCALVCHKNHELSPLIFKNKATRPKCDCRKMKCLINQRL